MQNAAETSFADSGAWLCVSCVLDSQIWLACVLDLGFVVRSEELMAQQRGYEFDVQWLRGNC